MRHRARAMMLKRGLRVGDFVEFGLEGDWHVGIVVKFQDGKARVEAFSIGNLTGAPPLKVDDPRLNFFGTAWKAGDLRVIDPDIECVSIDLDGRVETWSIRALYEAVVNR